MKKDLLSHLSSVRHGHNNSSDVQKKIAVDLYFRSVARPNIIITLCPKCRLDVMRGAFNGYNFT